MEINAKIMKSIRLKYCSAQGCTFKFVNRNNLKDFKIQESDGSTSLQLFLKTDEVILLSGTFESAEIVRQRWSRFETSEEIFFDLAEYEIVI